MSKRKKEMELQAVVPPVEPAELQAVVPPPEVIAQPPVRLFDVRLEKPGGDILTVGIPAEDYESAKRIAIDRFGAELKL